MSALLKAGADPNAVWHVAAHDSACPLALTVEGHNDSSSLTVMRLLLDAGASVNGRRGTRWPLGNAMERRRLALAVELMTRGADPKQWRRRGSDGERESGTPLVCAMVPTSADESGEATAAFWCALVRYTGEPDHPDLGELDTFLEHAPEAVARRVRSWRNAQLKVSGAKPKA